jgi:hypothetical protein
MDRISIPLVHHESAEIEPHPDVAEHLSKNNIKIKSYKAGLIEDPKYPNRSIKLGKYLQQTNAPQNVIDSFNNDPNRRAAKQVQKGLHVVISRHPHDVAGMSTDQGWTSCMDLDGGVNSHYMKNEIKNGTHVAYLCRSEDPEAKTPLARIALKPYTHKKSGETILRPEQTVYGDADNAFGHTVNSWAEKNFPADPETVHAVKNA